MQNNTLPTAGHYPLEVYRDDLRSICGEFNLQPHKNVREVFGYLSVRQTAGLDIACVGLDTEEVSRCASDIRRDPGNHFFLILQHKGRAGILQNETASLLDPGDMVIVDAAMSSRFCYTDGYSEQVSVHLPREEMQHRFGRRISGGISIPKEDMLGHAMRSIIAKLMAEEKASEPHVREALFGVLGAYLTERQKGQSADFNPDRLIVTRAIALMNEHFENGDFSTAALAALMGISLRRLQRAFKLTDETPHHRLQSIRIEHAYHAIAMRDNNKTKISTIAYSSGFNDLSTFYRCFKDRYQMSPGEHAAGS